MSRSAFSLLRSELSEPLVLVDVGAEGGALRTFREFGRKAQVYCFEAREAESQRLIERNRDGNVEYVPLALSNDEAGITVTVTELPSCSSAYPPVRSIVRRYPACGIMRPVGAVRCPSTTLDRFMEERGLPAVHAIKLDTQGFELNILSGAERALKTCLFVFVEVEFNELYEGQPLFWQVDRLMREYGFVLWRFDHLSHYATGEYGGQVHSMSIGTDPGSHQDVPVRHGQLFFADAMYVRAEATPVSEARLPRETAVAGAAIVGQWRLWDLALEMVRKSGDRELFANLAAQLQSVFVPAVRPRVEADEFKSQLPVGEGAATIDTDFSTTDCCLVFGPYTRLPEGEQEVTFHLDARGLGRQALRSKITLDVANNQKRVAAIELSGASGSEALRRGGVPLAFYNSAPRGDFEFRVFTEGVPFDGTLSFSHVSHRVVG